MMPVATNDPILLLGGTGKVSSRIAPLLAENDNPIVLASRSGKAPLLPKCHGIKFDWFDQTTYANLFNAGFNISAIFIIAPYSIDQLSLTKPFIDLAHTKGVKRLVYLSGSCFDVGDGPMMSVMSQYIISLNIEYAVLRPTWFMENFSETEHCDSIRERDSIVTAAGDGKVPFVSAEDIAAVAFRALTDVVSHDTDHLILGPGLFSYDEVAELLSESLRRKITHLRINEDEAAAGMTECGIPESYARLLAQLDTYISEGREELQNDTIFKVTGKHPVNFKDFVAKCIAKGIWVKK